MVFHPPHCSELLRLLFGEPRGQNAICRIGFQFLTAHTLEKIVQAHVLAAVNPLSCRIDLAVRLDGSNHGRSRDLDLTRFLDNALQGSTQITLPLSKKAKCVCVPIDAATIRQPVLLGEGGRTAPIYKLRFDLRTVAKAFSNCHL
jgi:hypothetical protein